MLIQLSTKVRPQPIDRYILDLSRITYLTDDQYTEKVFFIEEQRKVTKTNVFSINSQKLECPVDLREKTIQVRYDRSRRDRLTHTDVRNAGFAGAKSSASFTSTTNAWERHNR